MVLAGAASRKQRFDNSQFVFTYMIYHLLLEEKNALWQQKKG